MPLIDDLAADLPEGELTRRRLLTTLGTGALAVAGAGTAVVALSFLRPNVLYEPETKFVAGRLDAIAPGTVLVFPAKKVYLVHSAEGVYAMSATCTHLGCMTQYEASQDRIFCPCHGSRFDMAGRVTGGPAPRPLSRLEVTLDKGMLVVDTRKVVEPGTVLTV